ncbi:MAG TPA: hypothetical protein VLB87_10840, partial [Pyrinomonadaceae bacterium]|nr:hypothetical protein [Pyrinomonadaceae bacterium]
ASIELAVDAMKLGATDFVRKPFTPEVLRNALAAALAKPRVKAAVSAAIVHAPEPLIETVTMNGFTILDDETPAFEEQQRRFLVVTPGEEKHEVVVEIDLAAIEYVQRITGRYLGPESSFWTAQARRLLTDFLWDEGKAPPMHRLVLKNVGPEKLPVAARWNA